MKLLFADLDGTLLNSGSLISDETLESIKAFTEGGNLLIPASGRPLLSIQKLIDSTGISGYVRYIMAYNGALIYDQLQNRPVYESAVPFECARIIQDHCIENRIHIQTYNHETLYTVTEDMAVGYYRKRIFLPVVYSPDPLSLCDVPPFKMLAIDLDDRDRLCKLKDDLTPIIGSQVNMVFSNPYYLEFFNVNAGKGKALVELCKQLGVSIEDSFAAGDEENDISMIRAAGLGVAMKNATEPVKTAADVVTQKDNDHNGLFETILALELK